MDSGLDNETKFNTKFKTTALNLLSEDKTVNQLEHNNVCFFLYLNIPVSLTSFNMDSFEVEDKWDFSLANLRTLLVSNFLANITNKKYEIFFKFVFNYCLKNILFKDQFECKH